MTAEEVPRVQTLFDTNPEYFLGINGRRPLANEAQSEFEELPPPHLGFTRRWFLGLFDREHELIGVAVVLSDLGAAGVWHISLFLIVTTLHGQGAAQECYAALEAWMRQSGARWLRLGVIEGSTRASRFWNGRGYREVRVRHGLDTGGRLNTVRVLVKPCAGQALAEYLALVPRDHPDSTLP